MQLSPLIALELVFGFAAVGWGLWELRSLRRERRRDRDKARAARPSSAEGVGESKDAAKT